MHKFRYFKKKFKNLVQVLKIMVGFGPVLTNSNGSTSSSMHKFQGKKREEKEKKKKTI
jgi:hypothetical protein